MAGPSQAMTRSGATRIASSVASRTPAHSPRHPACAAATVVPSTSAKSTGMQSAACATQTTPACLVIAASPSRSAFVSRSITRLPCTCLSHAGSAGTRSRNRRRASAIFRSPNSRVVTKALTRAGACQSGRSIVAQAFDQPLHVARQGRLPRKRLLRLRVNQAELGRVQGLARKADAVARAAPVSHVADEWMANVLEVHADLVRAAGFETAFDQRRAPIALQHPIRRARRLAAVRDGHTGSDRKSVV